MTNLHNPEPRTEEKIEIDSEPMPDRKSAADQTLVMQPEQNHDKCYWRGTFPIHSHEVLLEEKKKHQARHETNRVNVDEPEPTQLQKTMKRLVMMWATNSEDSWMRALLRKRCTKAASECNHVSTFDSLLC